MVMFKQVNPKELDQNVFSLIGDQWMLISAGEEEKYNSMTASWGGLGVLFHKPVATIYVRPQRYTYEFIENKDEFTLSFFGEEYRDQLKLFGSKSGRDIDKMNVDGLTTCMIDEHAPAFEEAELVLVCKKLYFQDINPEGFVDPTIHDFYAKQDYHRIYIGEITKAFVK